MMTTSSADSFGTMTEDIKLFVLMLFPNIDTHEGFEMFQLRVITFSLLIAIASKTLAQELHEWKSKTGHTTKAAFLKVDEATRKVTLLVPKEIDFDTLEKESLDLALTLATHPGADSKKITSQTTPRTGTQQIAISNTVMINMVYVPNGRFLMGSTVDEEGRMENENQVSVDVSEFYMGQTEITQGQWFALMKTEPWKGQEFVKEGKDYPATWIDWFDAEAFCYALSKKLNKKCRLPTEAEWEYSCRASTTTSFGIDANEKLSDFAWWGAFARDGSSKDSKHASKVGIKRPNKYNLFDMHGNVWEWCYDWSADRLSGGLDPRGPDLGDKKVMRGGSWMNKPLDCRAAYRPPVAPTEKFNGLGFRIVMEVK